MRDIKLIQADIAKLQAELEDAKVYCAKRDAAVHILENLGWTHSARYGWKKPIPKPEVKASEYKAKVVSGELATYDDKVLGGDVYVRAVNYSSGNAQVSWARNIGTADAMIEETSFAVRIGELTVKPREYFIGR
uniref:Uncharacterized protein n=1 Tax=Klebsiella phage vB_Kpn16-P3 TaxID=3230847 RepID=A0AAU8EFR0_9VIRU